MRQSSAAIRAPRKLEMHHCDRPPLDSDEILVRIEHSGVCGSDLHFFSAGSPAPGTPFGHEITGRVTDAASSYLKLLGSRVVVNPYLFCGHCQHCKRNRPINCVRRRPSFETGFATHAQVKVSPNGSNIIVVPKGMPSVVAALAEPAAVALHAARRALRHCETTDDTQGPSNAPLLVLGAGPIGLLLTTFLAQSLEKRVWVLDRASYRGDLAESVGAEHVFGTQEELSSALGSLPGQDAPIVGSGPLPPVPIVFECSGSPALLALAAHSWVGRGGVLCQVAVFGHDAVVPVDSLLRKEADLVTSYAYATEDWPHALEFLSTHVDIVTSLIAEFEGLHDLEALLNDTIEGRIAQKPVVRVAV